MKTLISLLLISFSAYSQNFNVSLGEPSFSGSACGPYEASATLSPDGQVLSLLFDNFIAEVGDGLGKTDNKFCLTNIPIEVPENFQVAILTVDYRGFESLPFGTRSRIQTEYNFQHNNQKTRPLRHSKSKMGKDEEDEYFLSTKLGTQGIKLWSHCGKSTTLQIRTSLTLHANHLDDPAMVTIDSADSTIEQGIQYFLQYRPCKASGVADRGYGNTQGGDRVKQREENRKRRLERYRRYN